MFSVPMFWRLFVGVGRRGCAMLCVIACLLVLSWILPAPTNLPRVRVVCTHLWFSSLVFLRLRLFPAAQDASAKVTDIAVDSGTKNSTAAMVQQDSCNTAEQDERKRGRDGQPKAEFAFSPPINVIDLCDSPPPKCRQKAARREFLGTARERRFL